MKEMGGGAAGRGENREKIRGAEKGGKGMREEDYGSMGEKKGRRRRKSVGI